MVGSSTLAWQVLDRSGAPPGEFPSTSAVSGIAFLDLETGRFRFRRMEDCELEPASRIVLAHGSGNCTGVTAFDAKGNVRFRLLRENYRVQASSRYAYAAAGTGQWDQTITVIDLLEKRVVTRASVGERLHLLVGR